MLDLWYVDDGIIIGPTNEVLATFALVRSSLESIGLAVNTNKCRLWTQPSSQLPESVSPVPCVALDSSADSLVVLGFPQCQSEEVLRNFARKAVERATKAIQPLERLHHAQGELQILRSCGLTARLRHLLRISPEDCVISELKLADSVTINNITRIIGRPTPNDFHTVASAPIGEGGLGIELLSKIDVRTVAFNGLKSAKL